MVLAIAIALFKCFRALIELVITLFTLIFKCANAAILLVISLVTLTFKCTNAAILLVISLVTVIFKGANSAILLVSWLVIVIYKCFRIPVITFIDIWKYFSKKEVAEIQCENITAEGDDPERTADSPKPSITTADVILQLIPENREPQVGSVAVERFLGRMAREKPIRFSAHQLGSITRNYSTKLGSGGFGDVYKGELEDGVKVAVKVLKCDLEKRVHEQFMAEIGTIGRTYHVNVVKLYGFCFTPMITALVYEYMENGSLDRFLFGQQRLTDWGKLQNIALGVAKGIAYMHEECQQRIIHYDIKPENVLLDTNLNPKVADFGLAQLCNAGSSQVTLTSFRGTPGYVAPELWMPYPVTRKCDVYSFGMLLFEIVGRRRNLEHSTSETQEWLPRWAWNMFANGELLDMISLFSIEEKDRKEAGRMCMVAMWCVQYEAEARPTMSTVVRMLEGVTEIPLPPNPFAYLSSNELNVFDAYAINFSDSKITFSISEHEQELRSSS